MFYTIYKITNKINGKTYTGMHKTNNLEDGYMGSGRLIKRAIAKHGIENFEKEILHIFDNEDDMKNKEKEVVVIGENSYNLVEGGHGGFGYINRAGLSGAAAGGKSSYSKYPERFEAVRLLGVSAERSRKQAIRGHEEGWLSFKGKTHKQETKDKMSAAASKRVGEKSNQYGTMWITNGSVNKKIKKEELDFYKEQGYYNGRVCG